MTDQLTDDQPEKMNSPLDQTMFGEEGPLFSPEAPDPAQQKKKKTVLFVLLGGLVVIVIAIVGMNMLTRLPQDTPTISENTPTPTPVNVAELGPLDRLFYELGQDLELADPSENILPLPPVSARILISSEK